MSDLQKLFEQRGRLTWDIEILQSRLNVLNETINKAMREERSEPENGKIKKKVAEGV